MSLFSNKAKYNYTRLGDSLGQVQNSKKTRVYVFGEDDIEEDGKNDVVEFDLQNIRGRKGARSHQDDDPGGPLFVQRKLGEGETLQSVSLQYGCPVSYLRILCIFLRLEYFRNIYIYRRELFGSEK